jgi:Cu(I)/Ag(I) efflux system membrane fusion protein
MSKSKKMITQLRNIFIGIIAVLLVAVSGLTYKVLTMKPSEPNSASGQEEQFIYQSSMHPWIVSDKPGKCPICGMDLVKVPMKEYLARKAMQSDSIRGVMLSPASEVLSNAKTEQVTVEVFASVITANGTLMADERTERHLATPVAGKIVKQYLNYEGQLVRKGDAAFEIYSPDVVTSEREYLVALENLDAAKKSANAFAIESATDVMNAARKRLLNWQLSQSDITRLEATRDVRQTVTIHAEFSGVIIKKIVQEGLWVEAGKDLYDVEDYTNIWAVANVYVIDLNAIKVGSAAAVVLSSGETLQGKVAYVSPTIDPQTRTAQVRIDVPNSDLKLRPNTFVSIRLQTGKSQSAVMISKTAVLRTGKENLVWKKVGNGQYERKLVTLGGEQNDKVAVVSGLQKGDEVVSSAGFLIDSESELVSQRSAGFGSAK